MKKNLISFIGLILMVAIIALPAWSKTTQFLGENLEIMSLEDIKSGMVGYGLSVFDESQERKKFEVKIVTIEHYIHNKYIIWAKIWGGPDNIINRAGIIAGMSGSPVYLKDPKDGQYKLIGALAYGYAFQPPDEALAGITPIEEMLGLQNLLKAYYGKKNENKLQESHQIFPNPEKISIPLRLIGNKEVIKSFKAEMKKYIPFNFTDQKVPTTIISQQAETKTSSSQSNTNSGILKAGDAIAAILSVGDMTLGATGTVTLSNSKGFLAFGHPFFQTGYSNIPVFQAKIGVIVPNLMTSFKKNKEIAKSQLGLIVVDSLEGVLGLWHSQNTMLPLNINFRKYHLNGFKVENQWKIEIARKTPLTNEVLIASISYPIVLGSPYLADLNFDIRMNFAYKEQGIEKTISIVKTFFCKTPKEISQKIESFVDIYTIFEKAKKELIKIDINITVIQEKIDLPVIRLEDIEGKKEVEPGEKISLGLLLGDKIRTYSKVINLKAPDFQGKIEIKIQDKYCRLQDLISEALDDPIKIKKAFDFIKNSANKNNIFYVEIQHIKSISEREGKSDNGWKIASKRTEEIINKRIIEIELPEVEENFDLSISSQKTILVKKEDKKK